MTADSQTYTLADLRTGHPLNTVSGDLASASAAIDQAIHDVSTQRGEIGAFQSDELAPRLTQIATAREHLTSAVSLIRETDYATEVSSSIRYQLLYTASARMLRIADRASRGLFISA
jgi:flagellin